MGDFLDDLVKALPEYGHDFQKDDENQIKIAIVGRPNVGKSSLANQLFGEKRVVVNEKAGTTRDAIELMVEHKKRKFILVDTAGNAGSQSATLVIRALALGTVKMKDWLYLLLREVLVGIALGVVMGFGISIMGFIRGKSIHIAKVVVVAMIVNVTIGSLIGITLPFIFTKLKKDPATASTPLITTLADIIGTGVFLSIAYIMLN